MDKFIQIYGNISPNLKARFNIAVATLNLQRSAERKRQLKKYELFNQLLDGFSDWMLGGEDGETIESN